MSQCSKVNGQQSEFNSHVVTTVPRQAVECEARNPCIHDHEDIKSAEGTTEKLFCRTFGALIFLKLFFAGIPHFVLHHLPIVCRSYGAYLDVIWISGLWISGFLVVNGHSSKFRVQKKGAAFHSSSFYL